MNISRINKPHILVVALIIVALLENYFGFIKNATGNLFWDLKVYEVAVEKYNSGFDPYDLSDSLLFVYHPIVLQLFSLIGDGFIYIIGAFYFFACTTLFYEILKNRNYVLPFLLGFSFLGLGILSFATGNVTIFLHFTLLALLIRSVRVKGSFFHFLAAVGVSSIVKPYMLAYALVPLVVSYRKRDGLSSTFKLTVLIIFLVLMIVTLHSFVFNDLFFGFYTSLKTQALMRGDVGISMAGYLMQRDLTGGISLVLHMIFVLTVSFVVLGYFFIDKKGDEAAFIMALYFVFTLLNPRLKEYDLPALMFALFATIVFISNSLKDWIFILAANTLPIFSFFVKNGFFSSVQRVVFASTLLIFIALSMKLYDRTCCNRIRNN